MSRALVLTLAAAALPTSTTGTTGRRPGDRGPATATSRPALGRIARRARRACGGCCTIGSDRTATGRGVAAGLSAVATCDDRRG